MSETYRRLAFTRNETTNRRTKVVTHARHAQLSKLYDYYMIVVAIAASTIIYFQAGLILQNKSSENVSIPSYIILTIVSLSFVVYGVLWTDWLIIVAGIIATVGAILALVAAMSYRPSTTPGPFA